MLFLLVAPLAPALAQDSIVAIVNNEVITKKDLENFTNFTRIQLSQKLAGTELDAKIDSMKADLLQKLIEDKLILQEAKKQNVKVDESRVQAKLNELRKRYDSDREFTGALVQQGLSEADLEARIRDQMLMYSIIDSRIREKVQIKPAEITAYYNENKNDFIAPENRDLSSLSFEKEEDARKMAADLRQRNGDIDGLAKERGLKVNRFTAKKGELKSDLESALFALKAGDTSDALKVNGSYYVFRVNLVNSAREQSLSEVQEELSGLLYERKMQEGVAQWLDGLKKTAYIQIIK